MDVDPNFKAQQKYKSGNEGRLHPRFKHDGYFGPKTPFPPMDPKRLQHLKQQLERK